MVKELTRKMKDSGVEWIGEIPEDWEVVRNKNLFKNKKEIVGNEFETIDRLALTLKGVIDRDKLDSGGLQPTNFNTYQKVNKNNLIFKLIDLENINTSRVGLAHKDGMVSPAYVVLYSNSLKKDIRYYHYFYLSMWHRNIFNMLGDGGVRSNLNKTDLLNLNTLKINYNEQKSIADFLDKKTQEIDNIISKTKKAIEEYKRYKQSLITETVTKGLDENVEMKYSGIEWIGEIPEHWDTIKFKDLFKFGSGLTITKSDLLDEGIKVINYGEIHSKYKFDLDINRDELKCVDKSYLENRKNALINKGDFVFCDTSEDREGSGNCIVLRENNDELIFAGSHTVTARLIRNENPIYIRYMIMASSVKEQISSIVVGIKVYSITQAILKTIIGVLPPLKEQEEIANYLDKKCSQIDNIISTKEKLLTEMEAYKKSLIYETVTGKREVE